MLSAHETLKYCMLKSHWKVCIINRIKKNSAETEFFISIFYPMLIDQLFV